MLKKSRAPAVKISVMETLFEKGINKILLQKTFSEVFKYILLIQQLKNS